MDKDQKTQDVSSGSETKSEPQSGAHPHVEIFGEDVSNWRSRKKEWKEDWKKKKEDFREQWRANRSHHHAEHHDYHCHHYGGGFWGVVILFLGVVFLLNTFGFASTEFWHVIAPFWPVLLILCGIHIILGHNWFSRLVMFFVTVAVLGFIVAYGLARINSPLANHFSPTIINWTNRINPNQ